MYKTFILVTQEAEKLGAKHLPVFFETPCKKNRFFNKKMIFQKKQDLVFSVNST